jgi:hypothetical protein
MDLSSLANSLGSPDQVGTVLIPVQTNDYALYTTIFNNNRGGFTPPNELSFVFGESDQEYEVIVDSFTTQNRIKYNVLKVIYNGIKYKINAQGSIDYPSFFIKEFVSPGNYRTWYGSFIISNQIPFRAPFVLQPAGEANVTVTSGQRVTVKSVQPRRAGQVDRTAAAARGVETRRRNAAEMAAAREAAANVMPVDAGPSSRSLRAMARSDGDTKMLFGKRLRVSVKGVKKVISDIKYLLNI